MKKHGIPENQIVHLAFDDIANNRANPFKGQIFNKPTASGTPGVNVYEGCKIDYTGKEVTSDNVFAVLKGDATSASGPVLKTNENSKIFFYFADHGAPGLLAMPNRKSIFKADYIYADKLNEVFTYMHTNNLYKEMTVYIEACESGSMFKNILQPNVNIYALSAANPSESSWATYCSPNDKVNGKSVGSCLGDLFSVNWMEDSEASTMSTETLQQQFVNVKNLTTKSQVMQWGDLTFTTEPIADFESGSDATLKKVDKLFSKLKNFGKKVVHHLSAELDKSDFTVDSRDNELHFLYNQVLSNPSIVNQEALQKEIAHRIKVDKRFEAIFPDHMEAVRGSTVPLPTNFDCYRSLIDQYSEKCEIMDDYSLKYMKAFVAECEL